MSAPQNTAELSPIKRALLDIRELRSRVEELERGERAPIAVVGMSLRFPGASDVDGFWQLLREGRNAICEIPGSRWDVDQYYDADPAAKGKMYARSGGFLAAVDEFDAGFFGIHPREAVSMDPQQRLLLEVAWEALENAAQPPESFAESATGVYLGMAGSDYLRLMMTDTEDISTYTGTGGSSSIAAGRLSYLLGFNGPSLVIDTSCSSSLVAVHLACSSLRSNECRMALAAGVNLMLTPENTVALCKSRMLAPDGLCKAFDESADGFSRGEGCGVVVLKRLADALADGDYVHGVIRGSAVNQDGRSGGLTVPSGPAQAAVIRAALADARVDPRDISYVEAHGTGTSLGDPIEVHALISALCQNRGADRPLYLGSVKTNIGHLEAAAGVAGLIKTILSLGNDLIPPHIHYKKLNPHIDLGSAPIRIPTEGSPWPTGSETRIAGISSFGFSGTNAHVVVEGPPLRKVEPQENRPYTLTLSARSPEVLRETARRYSAWFHTHPGISPADVCFTASTGRKKFEHSANFTAASLAEFRGKLDAFAADGTPDSQRSAAPAPHGQRIPLPTYPFERSRYWIEQKRVEPWVAALDAAHKQASDIAPNFDVASYDKKWKTLHRLTTASIVEAFRELGAPLKPGEKYTPESLSQKAGIVPAYARLMSRWLSHLAALGICTAEPDGSFAVVNPATADGRDEIIAAAQSEFKDDPVLLEYAASCGRQLSVILSGKQSALETLFPNGDFTLAERLYEASPVSTYFNSVAAAAAGAGSRSRAGRCRILEVGAGTGATSAFVLPRLSAGSCEYSFTDVSGLFLNRARRKFAAYPFVHYGLLDLERDAAAQGYQPGGFDIVMATNVLHATADLPQVLARIRSLLSPGGMLVACEATEYLPWFDITTALIEGWQRYDDGIRHDSPLLTPTQWKKLLRDAGFEDAQSFPEEGAQTELLGQHVIIARAPKSVAAAQPGVSTAPAANDFREALQHAAATERRPLLENFVRERLAAVLGIHSPDALSMTQRLMDLGLDSLMALEFRDVLDRGLSLGGKLSSTLVFDFPNIQAVAAHLEAEIFGSQASSALVPAASTTIPKADGIAIIGAACRLPGGADDLDSFWTLLQTGVDAISEVPRDRWNIDEWYDPDPDTPGKMSTRWGGFIKGVKDFDPEFFGISPREAESMDPQQRLLMEVSWEALENAAQHPGRLGASRTGVFVGLTSDDYARMLARDGDLDTYYASGVARSVAAGRISYVLGLQGPNVSIDTACSSSLVAVHQACQSLKTGECRIALAGGANVMLLPDTGVALSRAHMMAPDGRCKAFDDSADGFVRAEGCVVLVLKRLSDALEDRDPILAVIRGSAVNQDGRSSGLTVPNGPAQEAVIRLALAEAGVKPSDVDYVEAHGTGTSLGDPIEVHALAAALGEGRSPESPLRVGSVKTNLGHLESAAGAVGLLKAALALSHSEIPPSLHFHRWNHNIDLKGVPVSVPVQRTPWNRGKRPRIAGVSSFGFSGTNVHVVLEEPPAAAPSQADSSVHTLVLSARSTSALRRLADRYCEFFDTRPDVDLADVCYTASACRATLPYQLEVRAQSVAEIRSSLAKAAANGDFRHETPTTPGEIEKPRQKVPLPLTPFEKQRYWRPDSRKGREHPLLGRRVTSPVLSQTIFEVSPRDWPLFLSEHRVRGKAILPMAGCLEMFLAASGASALEDVLVREPVVIDGGGTVQIVLNGEHVELYQRDRDDWKLRASARPAKAGNHLAPASIADLQARATGDVDPRQHYERLRATGVDLGNPFQLVRELRAGAREALGQLGAPDEVGNYRAHPALTDACIQVLSAAVGDTNDLYLPVGIDRFEVFEFPSTGLWSHASLRPASGDTLTADIQVLADGGQVAAQFDGLRLRRASSRRAENFLYGVAWREKRLTESASQPGVGNWLVFDDAGGSGAELAARMKDAQCRSVKPGEPSQGMLDDPDLGGVIYLRALDLLKPSTDGSSECAMCGDVLKLVQALASRKGSSPQLFLVTRGAQGPGDDVCPAPAPLWGLARTIRLEHPELRCVAIDLDPQGKDSVIPLLQELRYPDGEAQVAWRGAKRMVARLVPIEGNCIKAGLAKRGDLGGLVIEQTTRKQPGPGEVEIRVDAAGLNFRDVLNALDLYPGDPGPLGAECAGRIVAIGEGVEGFSVGDAVVAIAKGTLGSHVTASTNLVARKPSNLTAEQAAAMPVAYLTARFALHTQGKLEPTERVLIHAAAGGVGLAAIAEAQRMGAEIFATAGSEEKRAYLRSLGVKHVMSSRTLDFGREILERTGGKGVELVLNSLGGDFISTNLSVLAKNGRYLEIGKNGIWEPERVATERPDIRYFIIDWGAEYERAPETVAPIFQQLMADAEAGKIRPLPCRLFDLHNAQAAFRWMSQARHIGKIVLTPLPLKPDAAYLITGGLGGLGIRIAERLVERGARELVLLGRHAAGEKAQCAIRRMEAQGAHIAVHRADVSRRDQLQDVLCKIAESGPALKGIVHAAGVLSNAVLLQQDAEKFAEVMAPKVEGAWALHELTANLDLDFFIMFSSAASLLGAPGQANHSAANSFMDALAHYRRSRGLPAVSINWGPWSDIGAASEERATSHLSGRGVGFLTPEQGLEAFEIALIGDRPQVAAALVDWPEAQKALRLDKNYLAEITGRPSEPVAPATGHAELADVLARTEPGRVQEVLLEEVRRRACTVLGLPAGHATDPDRPLSDLGLDSLMAIELRNALSAAVGKPLPSTLIFSYPSIRALAGYLASEIQPAADADAPGAPAPAQPEEGDFLSRLEGLSEGEVDRLLNQAVEGVS